MRRTVFALSLLLPLAGPLSSQESPPVATAGEVHALLLEVAHEVVGTESQWSAVYAGTRIVVHAVDEYGRMRIMAPIVASADLGEAELRLLLEANYARALDAKFAIADGVVWSLFNRPLGRLDRESFLSGLEQVVTLKKNFGGSYRSTDLTFGRIGGECGR